MNRTALRILSQVAESGEVSLWEAIHISKPSHKRHLDQYPLSLLIEDGYLGMTLKHDPPPGAEAMREFSLATALHMLSLPKDERGEVKYLGIISGGSIDPKKERVFLKAKGALYLDEQSQRWWDRFWFFLLGLLAGVLATIASAWLRDQLRLP